MNSLLIFSLLCICSIFASIEPEEQTLEKQRTQLPYSLYEDLWDKNEQIADKTWNTKFLQTMNNGNLPADLYTTFIIQDMYYLVNVTDMLSELRNEVMKNDVKEFIDHKYQSYLKYEQSALKMYSLTEKSIITVNAAIEEYVNTYRMVMQKYDPIYFVVALLPCSRLWPYLAQRLSICQDSPYYSFKRDNQDGHPEKFKPLLDNNQDTINKTIAHEIFRQQMINEYTFFQSSYSGFL